MLALLESLAYNVMVWVHQWLSSQKIQRYGLLRMVCDVFRVCGLLCFGTSGSVVEIVLNQNAWTVHSSALLASCKGTVNLGELR